MTDVPDFSDVAEEYAASRPGYPAELFDWLAGTVTRHDSAWDAATGNGQAAWGLAGHFDRVIATDVSATQLAHARRHPRIEYRVAPAEASGLPGGSIDLVTAAAAVHWFDLPRFDEEVRRVLRPGGVVAVWTYHAAHLSPPLDGILGPFYWDVVGRYFAEGARKVDARYAGIELPGEAIEPPPFEASVRWTAAQALTYVATWSGLRAYVAATKHDPLPELGARIESAFGGPDVVREFKFPLYMRAARL